MKDKVKLVIEMSEEVYETIKESTTYTTWAECLLMSLVKSATPLPKGHGALKDVTPLMRGLYEEICTGEVIYNSSAVYKMIDEECSTIIEAEKE